MARLLKGEKMADPHRVRRTGYKIKTSNEKKTGSVRATRYTVPSNSVAAIASKFNAVVVEDELRGRALLKKKLSSSGHVGSVRETVLKFEGLQGAQVVLVRKNSSNLSERVQQAEKTTGRVSPAKPETRPKPTIDRKCNSRYVKKDHKEILGKEKRFSLPKNHLLDKVFSEEDPGKVLTRTDSLKKSVDDTIANECTAPKEKLNLKEKPKSEDKLTAQEPPVTQDCVDTEETTTPIINKSSLHRAKPVYIVEKSPSLEDVVNNDFESETPISNKKIPPLSDNIDYTSTIQPSTQNTVNRTPNLVERIYGNHEMIIANNDSKNNKIKQKESAEKEIRPNSSFLWGPKVTEISQIKPSIKTEEITSDENITNIKEYNSEEKENIQFNEVNSESVENKKNVETLEIPVVRTVDKKGYGKINAKANPSSLYRDLIGQMKVRLESMAEASESKSNETPQNEIATEKEKVPRTTYDNSKESSERGYEEIDETYEFVGIENSYDEIAGYDKSEAIYDDVSPQESEQIYESIYNGSRQPNDSDSSSDIQSNSLYGVRPPSQASSGGVERASRSDTSDEWVDIELDSPEEQIVLLQGTPRARPEGWSAKVRRQWSTRSAASRRIVTDSDSNGKHYEHVDNRDDDSAVCDDFDDSSDSEFSDVNNYKPNVEERLQPEVNQTEGIYGLMKEAGKRMRKTSSSIGKSLRRISRISKTTSAQDIFSTANGIMLKLKRQDVVVKEINLQEYSVPSQLYIASELCINTLGGGLSRGKWPSLKKKAPQGNSTFYLNEANTIRSAPPRPPPPDPRRLSISARPTSPPPPPPTHLNGENKGKAINDTSLYAECGLFEQNSSLDRRNNTNSWYSDIGLYENSKPFDTASEHGSSQGSDMDLRFADEPLYQFYTERVAKQELSEELSETGYEEIGENRSPQVRPSALDLVSPELQRTLWCQVPQVIASGILDTLTPERKRLQEAKFEVVTSEASYYKSLTILEKHFAASPQLKDESVLPKVHHKTLFGNVSAIRRCSEAVLAALEKCWQESILLEGLSDVINEVAEKHFLVYKKYCTNQLAIERTVKSLRKTNPAFAEALDALQKSPKCHNLTFYSFVLLPMQRITRMPLLQDAILTKLTPDDPEYESCRLALARLNKIVHECNEAARQSERMEEMMLLSRAITFPPEVRRIPLLSASRWLVRSGDLTHIPPEPKTTFSRKLTTSRQNKLKLFLFTDYLVVTKKKSEDNFIVVTYCERNLVQMTDVEDPIPNRFLIMLTLLKNHEGKMQEMVMCCGGESSRARWISALSPPAASNPGETLYEDWDCPQVCATHSYLPQQPDELQLQNGDVINVLRKTADGWYYGTRMRDEEKGWFPGNYTVEILSSHVRARNLKQRYRLLALSSNFIQKQQQQNKTGS